MPHKNPKGHGAKLLADITPRVDVMLYQRYPGRKDVCRPQFLGGCAVEYHFVA